MNDPSTLDTSGLRRAFAATRAVLAVVRDDQLDAPTPCASWNVDALIRHMIDAARSARDAIDGVTERVADTDENHTVGDYLDAYDDGIRKTPAAFGTLRADTSLFGGRLSASALLLMSTQDQFIHGWDLARAVGHSTNLDPELADGLLAHARTWVLDGHRGADGVGLFGPAARTSSEYPADRLAAFLGREM
ncbi:TIGR03086 family metal-binding protein [Nocardia noduli]|uniref:TIGR03086 family metal-binding protein n=1 Tax=Nocardia noduli TaxID=2815722 RepID=UPI001C23D5C1|nr:TIGR03086 family metal-binding protein [Nocardia noduli]